MILPFLNQSRSSTIMIYKLEIESEPKNLISFHTTLESAENLAKNLGYGKDYTITKGKFTEQ